MIFITIAKESSMKKFSMLLCAALLITGMAQAHTYNEAATAQLVEFLTSLHQDCGSKAEAVSVARKKMAQFITLIENGANPNINFPDGRGFSLLTSVVLLDFYCIIAQTNQSYVEAEQLTKEEVQEFITAVHSIIKVLLDYGANPNTRDNSELTALFFACSPEITKMLLDYGADRSAQDDRGKTALQHHEDAKHSMLEDIAQGKGGGWPFCFSIETQRTLVAHAEQVIEVLKTYKIN
jgi:uncharacterized protein (UPF0333 family)